MPCARLLYGGDSRRRSLDANGDGYAWRSSHRPRSTSNPRADQAWRACRGGGCTDSQNSINRCACSLSQRGTRSNQQSEVRACTQMKLQSRLRVRVCGCTNLELRRLGSIGSPIIGRAYDHTRIIVFWYADNIDPTCNCIDTSTNQTTTPSPPAPASTAAGDLCTATPTQYASSDRLRRIHTKQFSSPSTSISSARDYNERSSSPAARKSLNQS